MDKQFVVMAFAGVAALLSGCASQGVKNASAAVSKSEFVYGAVIEKHDYDTEQNRKLCAGSSKPEWASVCANLKDYDEVRIAILHQTRLVAGWLAVPKVWDVKPEAILKVRPSAAMAIELSAATPRAGCSWTGYSLDSLTSRAGVVKGFAEGLFIVPVLVKSVDDSITEGGVECNGWTYKSLLSDAQSK